MPPRSFECCHSPGKAAHCPHTFPHPHTYTRDAALRALMGLILLSCSSTSLILRFFTHPHHDAGFPSPVQTKTLLVLPWLSPLPSATLLNRMLETDSSSPKGIQMEVVLLLKKRRACVYKPAGFKQNKRIS